MFRKIYGTVAHSETRVKLRTVALNIGFFTFVLATSFSETLSYASYFVSVIRLTPLQNSDKLATYATIFCVKNPMPSINQPRKIRYQKIKKPLGRIDHPGADSHLKTLIAFEAYPLQNPSSFEYCVIVPYLYSETFS